MADNDGPPIHRPVPRRPFDLNFTTATPPDGEDSLSPPPSPNSELANLTSSLSSSRFLGVGGLPTPDGAASLSRPDSYLNLTASTLYGIFSPTASNSGHDALDDTGTPWGTGARTPVRRPSVDDATYELMCDRSRLPRRRSSFKPVDMTPKRSAAEKAMGLAVRVGVLFLLGVGYGVVISRFQIDHQQPLMSLPKDIIRRRLDWGHLLFWGVAGVGLGSLLPWLDKLWEETFGSELSDDQAVDDANGVPRKGGPGLGTDWVLVIRAIGAFVGIAFAIRRLAWSSTLQVTATLALANPVLWWLIDRSKTGLLLSVAVGLAGSMLLLGVNPEMMPAPTQHPYFRNSSSASHDTSTSPNSAHVERMMLGGLASQETVETGVWMLSVLFCSCICFGNIGRRLAWSNKASVTRGRWGGMR